MKTVLKYVAITLLVSIFSCEDTTIIKKYTGTGEEKTYSIEGYAQKGPFIVGTDVTVSELSEDLYPTGRVFFATILNDEGYFELPGVVLASPYVQIKVRGRYFSETGGYIPTEELTLYSLADVTNSETINVNILTHLEKERVEYLVQEENQSFDDAKAQAQEEVLKVFEWEALAVNGSEHLNISDDDTGGAVLLAMSSLFEVIDFVSRLETITNFKIDFADDGVLNSVSIQNRLVTSAASLNRPIIRENMESRYETEMPGFEGMLDLFMSNSSYTNYFDIIFPETYNGYTNLFRTQDRNLNSSTNYAFIVGAYPTGIEIGNIYYNFALDARFAASPEFPDGSVNNFGFVNTSEQLSWATGNYCPEYDYCAFTGWGKSFDDGNANHYVLPIEYAGTGKLNVTIQWDIDHANVVSALSFTW